MLTMRIHFFLLFCATNCESWSPKHTPSVACNGRRVNSRYGRSTYRNSDMGNSFSDALSSLNNSLFFSRTIQFGSGYSYSVPHFPQISKDNATAAFNGLLRSVSQPIVGIEALEMRVRVNRLERRVSALSEATESNRKGINFDPITSSGTEVVSALTRKKLLITPRTVEICAVAVFFLVGAVIGRSLLDRLWLVGGIGTACWAYAAVHRDTHGGAFVRTTGAYLAQCMQDIQERYNQAFVFYKTGKLAYISSKTWEKYDRQFSVTQRLDVLKKAALRRASEFNSTFSTQSRSALDRVTDLWRVVQPPMKREVWRGVGTEITQFAQGGLASAMLVVSPAFLGSRRVATLCAGVITRTVARVWTMFVPAPGEEIGQKPSRRGPRKENQQARRGGQPRAPVSLWKYAPGALRTYFGTVNPAAEARNRRGNLINPWSLPLALRRKEPTMPKWWEVFPARVPGGENKQAISSIDSEQVIVALLMLLVCVEATKLVNAI